MNESKTCTGCGEAKPRSEFHKRAKSSDGLAHRCKVCRRAANREYMATKYQHPDPDALKAYQAEYRRTNRDRLRAHAKQFREANKERIAADQAVYRAANAEALRRRKAEYHQRNAERIKAKVRQWVLENPEHARELAQRRRARIVGTRVGPVDLAALWTGFCGICSEPMDFNIKHPDPLSKSVDHIVPLARGGTHTQDNLQWAHFLCNLRKGLS